MFSRIFFTFVSFAASVVTVPALELASGHYTISDLDKIKYVASQGKVSNPVRVMGLRGQPQESEIWYLQQRSNPGSTSYKFQNQETFAVADTRGVPGAVIFTDQNSTKFFYIEPVDGDDYQISFDPYNVLVWTRSTVNDTVTLEQNTRSENQVWKLAAYNLAD